MGSFLDPLPRDLSWPYPIFRSAPAVAEKIASGTCKGAGVRLVFPLILVQPQQRALCAASTESIIYVS